MNKKLNLIPREIDIIVRITDLINWRQLSKMLSGNETSIRKDSCPKKYLQKVDALITFLEEWEGNKEPIKTFTVDEIKKHIDKL